MSASKLQWNTIPNDRLRPYYHQLSDRPPTAVLGHSIYLFRYDPADAFRQRLGIGSR